MVGSSLALLSKLQGPSCLTHVGREGGREKIYVGEGDEVLQRIVAHDNDDAREFWDRAVVFVSKDENLTKAHVRYLE
jgi:hypothetical protein